MKKSTQILKRLWNDESAQGATEYILLLVVVVAVVIAFKDQIQKAVQGKVGQLGDDIMNFGK